MTQSLFPDADLIEYVTQVYGAFMGCKVEEIFGSDLARESDFANSIRRSLTRELDARIQAAQFRAGLREAEVDV